MKRWIHAAKTTEERSVAFLIFDVCIDDEEAAASAQKVAAGSKKSNNHYNKTSKKEKTVKQILSNPEVFLNDFGNYIESLGFNLIFKPYDSNREDSISCYFYANMTEDFDAGRHEVDLVTVFCIRTSNHELTLAEIKNDIQDVWMQKFAGKLTNDVNQSIQVIRLQLNGGKSYSDYLAKCKDLFRQHCTYYRNYGEWPSSVIKEVKVK